MAQPRTHDSKDNNNPLLLSRFFPAYDEIKPCDVYPGIQELLRVSRQDLERLETLRTNDEARTFHSVDVWMRRLLVPFELLILRYHRVWGTVTLLTSVKADADLRKAFTESQQAVLEFEMDVNQSEHLHELFEMLRENKQCWDGLSPGWRRALEHRLREFRNGGGLLKTAEEKERYAAVELELASLSSRFVDNVMTDMRDVSIHVIDDRQIEGIPDSALQLARERAAANGDGTGWRFSLDLPSYVPVITHAKDRSLRETLYKAFVSKASKGDTDNVPVMERILVLRRQKARMLGYEHFAHLSCEDKMASFQEASRLLEDLSDSSMPAARKEMDEVVKFASENGHPEDDFKWWDLTFWSERLRETRYDFREEEELRPYLTLDNVLRGLVSLIDRLFDITMYELDHDTMRALDIRTWHPDVRVFVLLPSAAALADLSTSDEHAQTCDDDTRAARVEKVKKNARAFVYLDPCSRPGSKNAGAWMTAVSIRSDCPSYEENDGLELLFRVPIASVACNFSPPLSSSESKSDEERIERGPVFLTFKEAQELFHEFGHALQHTFTEEGCGLVSGYQGIEWDAVELPSQFMENWCYEKRTFREIARHHETGEIAPDATFEKLLSARTFRAAYQMQRQVHFARMDMELHSTFLAGGTETIFERERELADKTLAFPPMPKDRYLCSFTHVFAGSYAAGYYSYKWAEVLSADAFSAFENIFRDGENQSVPEEEKEKRVRETGRRFRDTVLARGGGAPPAQVFRAFRGRDPSTEPLIRMSGMLS